MKGKEKKNEKIERL